MPIRWNLCSLFFVQHFFGDIYLYMCRYMSGRGLSKVKSCLDGKLANLISEITFAADKCPQKKKCWTDTCERNASPCPWPTRDPRTCLGPAKRGWPQLGSASQPSHADSTHHNAPLPTKMPSRASDGDAATRCLDDGRAPGPFVVSRCHSHCCQWELDRAPREQQALGVLRRMRTCRFASAAPALPPSFGEVLQNKRLPSCFFRGTTTGQGWWAPRHFFLHLQDAAGLQAPISYFEAGKSSQRMCPLPEEGLSVLQQPERSCPGSIVTCQKYSANF